MIHTITVEQFTKMLHNLTAILDKGAGFADSKKTDVEVLLSSRLILDQFNLIKQVQIACDTAKLGVARLCGVEGQAPVHADNEKTLAELKDRIASVVSYLSKFTAKDFEGYEKRKIMQPRWNGKHIYGDEFLVQHVIPNFYFHITTAYAILRHNGVEVGKKDYLGPIPLKD